MITDGIIVEQGSHEELIRAKGKYADLWSKQVFLKPKVTETSKDAVAAESNKTLSVVKDLAAKVAESELARVQKPTIPAAKLAQASTQTRDGDDKELTGYVKEV